MPDLEDPGINARHCEKPTITASFIVIPSILFLQLAVLSAINPVEQINKGRDTGLRSDAAEMVNAIERYFAVHEFWPWLGDCSTGVAPCTYACAYVCAHAYACACAYAGVHA